ncbi:GGDEF domain-containing protein [Leptolinea tardivitalis]|uniref:GGDEF domain-containing protein n=1 Tax=Leptolinea tardivitalis TaxID=229920 RepID=A0A0P6WP85_9CHLR|nr:GGDEF domain-containing protein [Leptolinea tardivitalis]KPL71862.1 hypothetical protein ADM99_10655 [Leptolinea tardivitalis]GAP20264.1 protein containing diguanylate cyclase (GGDEF) domain [Leptolinea tardivitalis]
MKHSLFSITNSSITPDSSLSRGKLSEFSGQVDRLLDTGFKRLHFSEELENLFLRETSPYRQQQVAICLLIAVFMYDFFLITDRTMLSDIFTIVASIRLFVITPVLLLLVLLIYGGVQEKFREMSLPVLTFFIGISLIYFMSISQNPNKIFYHPGFLLIVIFANVVLRCQFTYAVASSLALFISYTFFYPSLEAMPPEIRMVDTTMLFSCIVLTLYTNYTLEYEQRMSYLFSLRERIRQEAVLAQNRRLTRMVSTDPLTRLANRREVDDFIDRLAEEPHPSQLSAIVLDIDHFKKYNDFYGHLAGDECLRHVAHEMRRVVQRKGDLIGRIGGEEFVALLPDADLSAGMEIAEKIRSSIYSKQIPHAGSENDTCVTISAGVSSGIVSGKTDIHTLMEEADAALYRAKAGGRNRVVSA